MSNGKDLKCSLKHFKYFQGWLRTMDLTSTAQISSYGVSSIVLFYNRVNGDLTPFFQFKINLIPMVIDELE